MFLRKGTVRDIPTLLHGLELRKCELENGLQLETAGGKLHFSLQTFLPLEQGDKECAVMWWGVPCVGKCLGSMHIHSHTLRTESKCPSGEST
jgi:hypothetical protein